MSTTFMDICLKSVCEGMDICVTCSSVCQEVQLELLAEDTMTVLRRLLHDFDLDSCLKILRPNKKLSLCETCHETLKNASLFRNEALKSLRELEKEWCRNQLQQNVQSTSAVENTLTIETIDIKVDIDPYPATELNPPGALQSAVLGNKTTESNDLPSFNDANIKNEYDSDDYALSVFHSVSSANKIDPKEEIIETDLLDCKEKIGSTLLRKGSMNLGLGSKKLRVFSGKSQGSKEDSHDMVNLKLIAPIFETSHRTQASKSSQQLKSKLVEKVGKNKPTQIKPVKITEKTLPARDKTMILSETESECESDPAKTDGGPIRGRQRIRISKMSESKPRKRGSTWDEDSLRRAMKAVQNNQLNTNAAALKFNIPRRTLRNHLASGDSTKIIGKTTILTKQQEEDLSQRIKRFAKLGVPLTPKFIRKQAFLFCERFKIKNSFSTSTRMAGRKWLNMFLSRNPSISKRKPHLMNPARAHKMNEPIVKDHFEEVKELYEELDIIAHPERLYNMEEKRCRITIHKQNVVLAEKGNNRAHLVAPQHAEDVTIAMCVNAVGIAMPPMIIFKGIGHRSELASNLPPGTKVSVAPKGSMTSSLFVEFIQHLAQHKVPGKCLLIFDGAKCHLSYEAVEAADKNNIELYCLPSNATHELQPLDKSVNRSFEHHWDEEVSNYLCNSQERTLNKAAFNKIFSRTWPKCMTQTNITNGFQATGLYPLNPDVIIPEDAYAPSIVTERPLSETLQHQIDQPLISVQVSPPVSEFKEVSELSSQSSIDERSADVSDVSSIFPSTSKEKIVSTSPKFSTATPKRKPVLVSDSSSTDASDLELGITVNDRFNVADTKHDPQTSLYDNPLPSTSGLLQQRPKNDSVKRLKRKVQKLNSKRSKIEKKKSAEG